MTSSPSYPDPNDEYFTQIDHMLATFVEENKDALDSSVFSQAGVLASPRAGLVFLLVGIMFLVGSLVAIVGTHVSWGLIGVVIVCCEAILIFVLLRNRHKQFRVELASIIFRFSIFPLFICYQVESACFCSDQFFNSSWCFHNPKSPCWATFIGSGLVLSLLLLCFLPRTGSFQLIGGMFICFLLAMKAGVYFIMADDDISAGFTFAGGSVVFLLMCYFIVRRHGAIQYAKAILENDRRAYEKAWNQYSDDFRGLQFVEQVQWKIADRIKHNWLKKEPWRKSSMLNAMVGQPIIRQPRNRKLSQLFYQGELVNRWFQVKMREVHRYLDLDEEDYQEPPIKSPRRTIEKVKRLYFGRFDRVCDIVRASIVCENLTQVSIVIQYLEERFHDFRILRMKNRFTWAQHKVDAIGGYRDLQLSLQTCGFDLPGIPEDIAQKCRNHIAELQIHLRAIHDVKHDLNNENTAIMGDHHSDAEDIMAPTTSNGSTLEQKLIPARFRERLESKANVLGFGLKRRSVRDIRTGHDRYKTWRTITNR